MRKLRLLLVEKEDSFRASIPASDAMEVTQTTSPARMDELLRQYTPDVVLLDINMAQDNGFEISRRLINYANCGIVLLCASVEERVEGLNHGVDYCLQKPVDGRELLAVVDNVYNRHHSTANHPSWELNTTSWLLTTPDKQNHELVKSELQILATLACNPGEPVSRRQLYSSLGLPDFAPASRSLDIQISRLRRRFTTKYYSIPIKTVHSVGYLFNDPISVRN